MGALTYPLVRCANPRCPLRSRTSPEIAQGWERGLCPECRDPQALREVQEICRRPEPEGVRRQARPRDAGR